MSGAAAAGSRLQDAALVCLAAVLACALAAPARAAEEYSFDASQFATKPLELGGLADLKHEDFRLNRDSAFYRLNFYNQARPERKIGRAHV